MMGIEVSETCLGYHKCNKAFSDIKLVLFSTHMQRCTDKHTSVLNWGRLKAGF